MIDTSSLAPHRLENWRTQAANGVARWRLQAPTGNMAEAMIRYFDIAQELAA